MVMPIDLVLVRHGESEGNVAARRSWEGDHSDYTPQFLSRHNSLWRLTDRGVEQSKIAGDWIRANIGIYFDRYYSSEYIRAMETAFYLNLPEAEWYCDFYLREKDWGNIDVMSVEERNNRFGFELKRKEINSFYWAPPDGESMARLCLRVDRILDTLHRECSDKRVIIVCHGEVMWSFRVRIERMTERRYGDLEKSKDSSHKINNGQILQYTRANPEGGGIVSYMGWVRSVCPWNMNLSSNEWKEIVRGKYTNEDLLREVQKVGRTIS